MSIQTIQNVLKIYNMKVPMKKKNHYYLSFILGFCSRIQRMDYRGLEEGYLVNWNENYQIWIRWLELGVEIIESIFI